MYAAHRIELSMRHKARRYSNRELTPGLWIGGKRKKKKRKKRIEVVETRLNNLGYGSELGFIGMERH